MTDILHYSQLTIPNLWLLISLAVTTIVIVGGWILRKTENIRNYTVLCIWAEYFFLVLCATVFCRPNTGKHEYNLVPFTKYINFFTTDKSYLPGVIIEEILMNILMFVPIGLFYGSFRIKHHNGFCLAILTGLTLSCGIEILQLVLCRGYCETYDVIHNTFGCIIGYTITLLVKDYTRKEF